MDRSPSRDPASRKQSLEQHAPLLAATGAALAAAATFVQYRTRQAESEHPPQGKFVEVDGVRLHYLERGEGRPLVLLHGNATMAAEFDISGLLGMAADKYRVIAFDRPGYGYSERPRTRIWTPMAQAKLLYGALQQLGIERPILLGHSWGTMVAVAFALEYPQQVRSLVLASGYYYPTPRLDVPLLSPPAIPLIGDLMCYTVSPLLGRVLWPAFLKKLFSPARISERFRREYPAWMTLRPSQLHASAAEAAMMIPSADSLSARYRELTMPVVIVSGEGDLHVLPWIHSQRLHRELPQSELVLVSGAGHMVHHTSPERVMAAIDMAAAAEPAPIPLAQPARLLERGM